MFFIAHAICYNNKFKYNQYKEYKMVETTDVKTQILDMFNTSHRLWKDEGEYNHSIIDSDKSVLLSFEPFLRPFIIADNNWAKEWGYFYKRGIALGHPAPSQEDYKVAGMYYPFLSHLTDYLQEITEGKIPHDPEKLKNFLISFLERFGIFVRILRDDALAVFLRDSLKWANIGQARPIEQVGENNSLGPLCACLYRSKAISARHDINDGTLKQLLHTTLEQNSNVATLIQERQGEERRVIQSYFDQMKKIVQ